MKLNKMFAILLAGFTFIACSNDEIDVQQSNTSKAPGTLVLKVETQAKTKALGTVTQQAKYAPVGALDVFVYSGDDILAHQTVAPDKQATSADALVKTLTFSNIPGVATSRVYVIANAPAGSFTGKTTLTEVKAVAYTFESQNTANENEDAGNVILEGATTAAPSVVTADKEYSASVLICPALSRIEINSIDTKDNSGIESFTIEGIYLNHYLDSMNFAPKSYKYFAPILRGDFITPNEGLSENTNIDDLIANKTIKAESITGAPTKGTNFVAYNFFPGEMPHLLIKVKVVYTAEYKAANPVGLKEEGWLTVKAYTKSGGTDHSTAARKEVYVIDTITFGPSSITEQPYETTTSLTVTINVCPWLGVPLDNIEL